MIDNADLFKIDNNSLHTAKVTIDNLRRIAKVPSIGSIKVDSVVSIIECNFLLEDRRWLVESFLDSIQAIL